VPHSSPCLTSLANVQPREGASASRFTPMYRLATVVRRFFRRVFTFTTGDWDSSNQAFTMSAGSNATCPTASSSSGAFLPACSCPVGLSTAGKLVAQTPPSSVSRLSRGYDDAPHGAHRAGAFRLTRLLDGWPWSKALLWCPMQFALLDGYRGQTLHVEVGCPDRLGRCLVVCPRK
jgi:hypothetical protein